MGERVKRKLIGVAFASSLIAAATLVDTSPALAAPSAPGSTFSLYVSTASNAQLCLWGKNLAAGQNATTIDGDAFIFMHFFGPMRFTSGGGTSYGASRSSGPDETTGQIRTAAQKLGQCWYNKTSEGETLKIAMGVTNDNTFSAVTAAHGNAWALMVKAADDWAATNSYSSRLSFNGGFDAEPSFSSLQEATNWITGYKNANTGWNVFFYGGASGCPSDKNPGYVCTWSQDNLIDLAWDTGVTTPFPQIYLEYPPGDPGPPTSEQAQQWQLLSARAVVLGEGRMNFSGGLSQKQACIDLGHPAPQCTGTELAPNLSWRDLWDEINCTYGPGSCTTNDDLRWTTQLTWKQQP